VRCLSPLIFSQNREQTRKGMKTRLGFRSPQGHSAWRYSACLPLIPRPESGTDPQRDENPAGFSPPAGALRSNAQSAGTPLCRNGRS
jgi:hypothetical protein